MIMNLKNQSYAPKWEQGEGKIKELPILRVSHVCYKFRSSPPWFVTHTNHSPCVTRRKFNCVSQPKISGLYWIQNFYKTVTQLSRLPYWSFCLWQFQWIVNFNTFWISEEGIIWTQWNLCSLYKANKNISCTSRREVLKFDVGDLH
jgi:hypothetical protein